MRILAFLLSLVTPWCGDAPTIPTSSFDTPFELRLQQSSKLQPGGTVIRFVRIINESRCPTGVMCVWAGEATIGISVEHPGSEKAEFPLKIGGYVTRENTSAHMPVDTMGYRITLLELNPYPKHQSATSPLAVSALLKVSRLVR